jgi:RNA polymerase sigma-70 factor (ECF subfamily)
MEESQLISTYRECVTPLYSYISRRCGADRGLAEDVTQEAWLRAVESWKKKGLPENPLAWLKTVARNLLLNYLRRAPPISLEKLPHDWERRFLGNGANREPTDHTAALIWGLSHLRPSQARLIEAFHIEGRKTAELAADLGITERAVEGRLRRARLKLKKKLEPVVGSGGELS